MNMVAHQAPAKNLQVVTERLLTKGLDISQSVVVGKKDALFVVTALSYMLWHTKDHNSRSTRHTSIVLYKAHGPLTIARNTVERGLYELKHVGVPQYPEPQRREKGV